jgi:hypothetical protein
MFKKYLMLLFMFPAFGHCVAASTLTDKVLSYANGSNGIKPYKEGTKQGFNIKYWIGPSDIKADAVMMLYCYSLGPDCWSIGVKNPKFDVSSLITTSDLTYLGAPGAPPDVKLKAPMLAKFYSINSGVFRGMFLMTTRMGSVTSIMMMTKLYTTTSPSLKMLANGGK